MDTTNDFFANATPAQINQLEGSGPTELPSPVAEPVQEEVEHVAQPEQTVIEQPQQQEQLESPQQLRFRELRERMLKAEWDREQLQKRLSDLESVRVPQQDREEDLEFGIGPDDIVEGKHLDKIIKAVEKRSEAKFQQQQAVTMQTLVENRLKSEIPDLDAVVTAESIGRLRQEYPELANTIYSNPDLYSKAKAAYTMITKLGLSTAPSYIADKERIKQNLAKPKTAPAFNARGSALAQAENFESGTLTKDTQERLWNEMRKAMNA